MIENIQKIKICFARIILCKLLKYNI